MSLMTNNRFFYFISVFLMLQTALYSTTLSDHERQRIACVGDSLTYGYGLINREQNSYPSLLTQLFPAGYDIRNFGINGACATPGKSDYYLNNGVQEIIDWNPDILIIMLGSNDSKEINWQSGTKYREGMENIIRTLKGQNSEVILMTPPPCRFNPYGIRDSVIRDEVIPALEILCGEDDYVLIDLYSPLENKENIYIDNIHLNRKGYSLMTEEIYSYLINNKK